MTTKALNKNEVSQLLHLLTKAYPNCCVFDGTAVIGSDIAKATSIVFPILDEGEEEGDTHWSLFALLPGYERILYFGAPSAAQAEKLGKACLLNWLCHLLDSSFRTLGTARDWKAARPWYIVHFDISYMRSTIIDRAVPILYFICQTASYPYPPERIDPFLDLTNFPAALRNSLKQGEFIGLASRPTRYDHPFRPFATPTTAKPALERVLPRTSEQNGHQQPEKPKTIVHASVAALAEAHDQSRARLAQWDAHRGELHGYIVCSENSVRVVKKNVATIKSNEVFKIPDLLIGMVTDFA